MNITGLPDFKLKAVVDRIRVKVMLRNPSQPRYLQDRTAEVWGKTYFFSVGETDTTWEFWIQDPAGPTQFMRDVQAMRGPGEPPITEDQIRITGIELAIDAYHPSNDPEILACAALHFIRHRERLADGLPRIPIPAYFDWPDLAAQWKETKAAYAAAKADARRRGVEPPPPLDEPRGEHPTVESLAHARQALRRGLGIHQGRAPHKKTGECKDALAQHVYVKTTDTARGGQSHAPLPPEHWRARMEDRLQCDDPEKHPPLPFDTIAAWRTFRFETLAGNFSLLSLTPPSTPLAALMRERITQFGRTSDAPDKGRPKNRRRNWGYTRTDTAGNNKIRMALRALDSKFMVSKR